MFAHEFLHSVYIGLLFAEKGMSVRIVRVVCAAILTVSLLTAQVAQAIETSETTLLPMPPLLITSYQTKDGGKDLQYVELYNSGKTMVRIEDWMVRDVANGRDLLLSTPYSGVVEPGKHVVATRAGVVSQASFMIGGWNTPGSGAVMTSLQLARSGFRTLDATLSSRADDRDKMMTRNYNTDSYSTAASPFVQVALQNYRPSDHPLFEDGLYAAPPHPGVVIVEIYPYASSCSPFDTSVLCGDYIKLYNHTGSVASLDDIVLRTDSSSSSRTTANTFALGGVMAPGEYKTVWLTDTSARISLTNSGGYAWLEDTYGMITPYADTIVHYESAGTSLQGYAYALNDNGEWEWTATPMPAAANVITPAPAAACPDGKYRNPDTGRCRTLEETINALAACEEGYERNPTTNRCRKIASGSSTSLTPCKEGQERNPATNRCRSIASAIAELLPCDEGYERNPATNRCRKVQGGNVLGAEYPVEPYKQEGAAIATWWVVGGIAALAAGYGVWEWRREIGAGVSRLKHWWPLRRK